MGCGASTKPKYTASEKSTPPASQTITITVAPILSALCYIFSAPTNDIRRALAGDPSFQNGRFCTVPKSLLQPRHWGMRTGDIISFHNYIKDDLCRLKGPTANLHDVVTLYVKPWTVPFGNYGFSSVQAMDWACREYGDLSIVMRAQVFVSHCWNEDFKDFVATMKRTLHVDDVVWICAFALCQHVDIASTLGATVEESPFWLAMHNCERVLVFTDSKGEVFDRIWCALEQHLALYKLRLPLKFCLPDDFDTASWHSVVAKLRSFSLRNCTASKQQDVIKIMSIMADSVSIVDRIIQQEASKAFFAAKALQVSRHGTINDTLNMALECFLHVRDAAGKNVVHLLAEDNRCDQLEALLDQYNISLDNRCNAGQSALHCAAIAGKAEVVSLLLKYRTECDVKDARMLTPLHSAVINDRKSVVTLLLQARADPESRESVHGHTPLISAGFVPSLGIVQQLVDHRAELEGADKYGFTVLLSAAMNGSLDVVQLLFASRADINCRNNHGYSALMKATQKSHEIMVKFLLDEKADQNVKSHNGTNVIDLATKQGNERILFMLGVQPSIL